jgi:bacterial/archaeal transporter family-2 protein
MPGFLILVYAAAAGALTNVQVGANLRLSKGFDNPALSAIAVLLSGLASACVIAVAWWLAAGLPLPKRAGLAEIPWWAWAGGALQGVTLFAVFLAAGRTGAALFSALTVTGGAICSILLDHYGLVGFAPHPISWSRVAGAALLIGGTVLLAR